MPSTVIDLTGSEFWPFRGFWGLTMHMHKRTKFQQNRAMQGCYVIN